jgi:hypothetical protein
VYVHVARGDIDANGISLSGGDALRIADASSLELERIPVMKGHRSG